MSEEEKGFVIKDRRALDEKGELKEKDLNEEKKGTKEQAAKEEAQKPPLPEANFTSLIFSLSSSALFHFGEIPDPTTGEKKEDLPIAKHAIDTIAMLKEKTQGNLTEEEQKFIESVLTDLKWRFVKAAK
ncbi:MAG: DUF1844 domain-containing protein [Deltaproteobacteria bacterium]|nr:DUF1844 domain-containing protein [Deltaproteobacteria bacterium]MBW1910397.1 DUF1844 domain-containing protein [Deltaproteobacteria bacterium]MBW2033750.1 DUF1844 domain-containing protein [Deltaproteobacteria bacterium]MBW2168542.1 DUF1844 domain-containing protein [Deltaproteobacteria bacterium]